MDRAGILSPEERLGHPGWCINLVEAGRVGSGEHDGRAVEFP